MINDNMDEKEARSALLFLSLIEFCFPLMVFAEKLAYNKDLISFPAKVKFMIYMYFSIFAHDSSHITNKKMLRLQ